MFLHPRGHRHRHRQPGGFQIITILFQASVDFKVSYRYRYRLACRSLPRFLSLSAPPSSDVTNTVSPVPLLAHRFSQPHGKSERPQRLAGLFHPAGTRRVLIFRALPTIDRELSPVLPAPSLFPALHGVLPDVTGACHAPDHAGLTQP